jgi:pyruvate/2-oxoglutarate dehydrogenase complex dihydrolipoamide dehydrogenase (E3) component
VETARAGIIAIEYAKIFSTLDCRVTMIVRSKSLEAALKRIGVDRDITLGLQRDLCTNKVRIIFDAQIEEVLEPPQGRAGGPRRPISIKVKQASSGKPLSEIRSDILMTATGRSANTDGLSPTCPGSACFRNLTRRTLWVRGQGWGSNRWGSR